MLKRFTCHIFITINLIRGQSLRYFSLFSGIGGFELGIRHSGVESECVGYSEVDKYAEAIYRYRFPGHEGYGDATGIISDRVPDFDLLVAGFPCQAFSIAGKRRGFQDARGTLFFEIVRLCNEKRPRHILLENVRGLLGHGHGETFQTILGFLSDAGYILQWEVLNSRDYGVPQNRKRVFIIGHIRGERRPEVFPLGGGCESLENEVKLEYVGAVTAPGSTKRIEGDGDKSREYREGQRVYSADGLASALTVNKGYYGQATGLYRIGLIHGKTSRQWRVYDTEGLAVALAGNAGGVGAKTGLYKVGTLATGKDSPRAVLLDKNIDGKVYSYDEVTPPLRSAPTNYNMSVNGIRRLTPTECERLQSFPDDWTRVGLMEDTETEISDTQRYKCLGNAVTVNVIAEVIRRLFDKQETYGH